MTPTTILLIAAGLLLALVLGFVAARWSSTHKTPAAVAKVESAIADDGWKMLAKTVAYVADGTAKKQAVANASAELAEHFANVAKLKAAVSALPEA